MSRSVRTSLLSLRLYFHGAAQASEILNVAGPSGPLVGEAIQVPHSLATVIILPGSGPTDRNGNGPHLMTNSYKLLAEGLAHEGISSLRIDKRGIGASANALSSIEEENITIDDYVHDIKEWQEKFTPTTGHQCVWLIGHSEGGLIALLTAAEASTHKPCGLILISTAGRNIDKVILDQIGRNPANREYVNELKAIFDSLKQGKRVPINSISSPLRPLFHKDAQSLLISELAFSVLDLAKNVKQPTLIIQGNKDIQISTEDAHLLDESLPNARLVIIKDMTHMLKDNQAGSPLATYQNQHLPLSADLVPTIADFIRTHSDK